MSAAEQARLDIDGDQAQGTALGALIHARVSCKGGATRTEIIRDLGPFVSHKLSPADWRSTVDSQIAVLLAAGALSASRNRYSATEAGQTATRQWLNLKAKSQSDWPELRDGPLVAKALNLEGESTSKRKAFGTPDGLRAMIVQNAFGLPLKPTQTPSQLRASLALLALERAFGNKIKTGFGAGKGFSAKAGRLLAAQLSTRPREHASDARLIATLAAESVDARQGDPESLRQAVLRGLVSRKLSPGTEAKPAVRKSQTSNKPTQEPSPPANDTGPVAGKTAPVSRPDPAGFADEVQTAAGECAEGWPGNRKAYISRVWQAIRERRPEWGLSEIEFKCMLAEAHRAGHLALATADLKNKSSMPEIEASAIGYKNTVWHLVRVED